jgi:cytochrome c biogenesis protein CcdA
MPLSIVFAFLAGLVTVASPCILPVLPIALSAAALRGRLRPLGVIVGLVASFSIFTLAISEVVGLIGLSAGTLRLAAVVIIGLLGVAMIVPSLRDRLEGSFSRLPGLAPKAGGSGWWGGLLTGAALGLVWAPCAGPVLAAITTLAATSRVTSQVVAVTAAYALGVGAPLLVVAYGGQAAMRRVPALARRSLGVQRAFGGLMLVMALLIAFNADVAVTVWATSALPADWNNRLQAFETSPAVQAQLDGLLGRTNTAPAGAPALAQSVAPSDQSIQSDTPAQTPPTAAPPAAPQTAVQGASTQAPAAPSASAGRLNAGARRAIGLHRNVHPRCCIRQEWYNEPGDANRPAGRRSG